jgi:hypothetical protein
MTDGGGIAAQRLRSFIERIERLEEEKAALAADKRRPRRAGGPARPLQGRPGLGWLGNGSDPDATPGLRACGVVTLLYTQEYKVK